MDIFACFGQKKNVYRTFVGRHGAFIMAIEIEQGATGQITGSDGPPECGSGGAPVSGLFFQSPPGRREILPNLLCSGTTKILADVVHPAARRSAGRGLTNQRTPRLASYKARGETR
jgi:hypothetical protein